MLSSVLFRSCNLCVFLLFGHKVTAANNVTADEEWKLVPGISSCLPSLNSPGSNLQTAAEFWQILPWCPLPLGDTFVFFLSSALVFTPWSTWPLKLLSVLFFIHVWKTKWIYRVYCQPLPFSGLMNVVPSSISSLLFPPHLSMMTWSFFLL